PFFVMATQNPIEYAGTYPLPEAQLDRFLMKLSIGYPTVAEELEVLNRLESSRPLERLTSVLTPKDILEMQAEVNAIYVDELVKAYIVELVHMTRQHSDVRLGVSPRGTIALMKAGQAYAYLQERNYVIPDDIKMLAPYVLAHRLLLRADLDLSGSTQEKVIVDVLAHVSIPLSKKESLYG
ncbi:MAG TPA: MoxR family ATPase, partial [Bacilli bacterium]|nr:MoxR family ATPase [Bacilli bacterium]